MTNSVIKSFDNDYQFLSNFYLTNIYYGEVIYPSLENAYQAQKTTIEAQRHRISLVSPGQAKVIGRNVKLRPDWESIKDAVMRDLINIKFSHGILANMLLSTGDAYLEEGNYWHDNYWGVCYCFRCQAKDQPKALNKLGQMLMEKRSQIRRSNQKPSWIEALKRAHDLMDDENAKQESARCVWCDSTHYDGNGLIHDDSCIILAIRGILNAY